MDDRRLKAIALRKKGYSIKRIAKQLPEAQSSVSIWTRGINLSIEQKEELKSHTHSRATIEKRRDTRLRNELDKRNKIIDLASRNIGNITDRELWLIGIALYWAEGGKTQGTVRFSNGDPRMITLMLRFFKDLCGVDPDRLRAHIHLHESLDTYKAEDYWQKITKIPAKQFYKTYNKPNISSKGLRTSLPYGVCDIYAPRPKLFLKIQGWTEGIYQSVIK